MKNLLRYCFALILFATLCLVSCEDEYDEINREEENPNTENVVRGTLNGTVTFFR